MVCHSFGSCASFSIASAYPWLNYYRQWPVQFVLFSFPFELMLSEVFSNSSSYRFTAIDHQNTGSSKKRAFSKKTFLFILWRRLLLVGSYIGRGEITLEIFDKPDWLKIIAHWVTKKLRQRISEPFWNRFYQESSGDHSSDSRLHGQDTLVLKYTLIMFRV